MTQQQSPLPVQPIDYATTIQNPWRTVSRLCASFGIAVGCVEMSQVLLAAWPFVGGAGWGIASKIVYAGGGLLSGVVGLLVLTGSLLLLRNPRSSELLVAGCWTSIVVTALMMVATSLVNMVEGYYRRNPIQLGFLILDFIAQAVIGVMWPLMTILLMRNARRDPQFCAMTPG